MMLKNFKLWYDGCAVQKAHMVFMIIHLLLSLVLIVALWTLKMAPTMTQTEQLQYQIIQEFRTRLTIYIAVTAIVNFFAQNFILNMFCRSKYNTNTTMSIIVYFIVFAIVFAISAAVVGLCASPILLDFSKKYQNAKGPIVN